MKIPIIANINDYMIYLFHLRQQSSDYHWFRGHACIDWEPIPSIHRKYQEFLNRKENFFQHERYDTNDFQARASVFISNQPPIDDFSGWLTLMQHYRLPTRLLDWSRSALIALYFAVSNERYKDNHGCIWILKPGKLNEYEKLEKDSEASDGSVIKNVYIYHMKHKTIHTMIFTAFRRWKLNNFSTPEDIKFNHRMEDLDDKIAACYPTENDARVYNQQSVFTVHNSLRRLNNIHKGSLLKKIAIPAYVKTSLLNQLSICGITQSSLFPDLEHLALEFDHTYQNTDLNVYSKNDLMQIYSSEEIDKYNWELQ